jgi:hypothetical protein
MVKFSVGEYSCMLNKLAIPVNQLRLNLFDFNSKLSVKLIQIMLPYPLLSGFKKSPARPQLFNLKTEV